MIEHTENVEVTVRSESDSTPQVIHDLLMFPYRHFSDCYGVKTGSLLDIACGNNFQKTILKESFDNVISADIEKTSEDVVVASITDIPLGSETFDVAFSFETIEHVERTNHDLAITELLKVVKRGGRVVVGSVNADGPTHLGQVEIWKGELNPFHISEMTSSEWGKFFKKYKAQVYQSKYDGERFFMSKEISDSGVCNYAVIQKE
jgi:ubiquinone/menaquinone biosynthesis C-methylase UbiE